MNIDFRDVLAIIDERNHITNQARRRLELRGVFDPRSHPVCNKESLYDLSRRYDNALFAEERFVARELARLEIA